MTWQSRRGWRQRQHFICPSSCLDISREFVIIIHLLRVAWWSRGSEVLSRTFQKSSFSTQSVLYSRLDWRATKFECTFSSFRACRAISRDLHYFLSSPNLAANILLWRCWGLLLVVVLVSLQIFLRTKKKLQRAVWCAVAVRCLQFGTDRRIAAQQVNKN